MTEIRAGGISAARGTVHRSGMRPILLVLFLVLLRDAAAVDALDPNELNAAGVRAAKGGDFDLAVDAFRRALEIETTRPEKIRANLFTALKNRSITLAQAGAADEAVADCSEALRLVPTDITVAANLAVFFNNQAIEFAKTGDFEQAKRSIEDSERVVDEFGLDYVGENIVRRTHARIYVLEARDRFQEQDTTRAQALLGKALSIDGDEEFAYRDRAWIYYARESYHDALADLQRVNEIQGGNPAVENWIETVKMLARKAGQPVDGQDPFFTLKSGGGDPSAETEIRGKLTEIRLRAKDELAVNPKTRIVLNLDWSEPPLTVDQWLRTPPRRIDGTTVSLGANGVDPNAREFQEALSFHFLLGLPFNLGGPATPYWFASGLAQIEYTPGPEMTPEDLEHLVSARDSGLLLGIEHLTMEKMQQLDADPVTVLRANLESKAMVFYLWKLIGSEGLGQVLLLLEKGETLEQAVHQISTRTVQEIEEEWRRVVNLAGL